MNVWWLMLLEFKYCDVIGCDLDFFIDCLLVYIMWFFLCLVVFVSLIFVMFCALLAFFMRLNDK